MVLRLVAVWFESGWYWKGHFDLEDQKGIPNWSFMSGTWADVRISIEGNDLLQLGPLECEDNTWPW